MSEEGLRGCEWGDVADTPPKLNEPLQRLGDSVLGQPRIVDTSYARV
jgi:hypothetical protein